MVRHNIARCFEPEGAYLIEYLSFERNRREDPVECALPVGGDKQQTIPEVVVEAARIGENVSRRDPAQ